MQKTYNGDVKNVALETHKTTTTTTVNNYHQCYIESAGGVQGGTHDRVTMAEVTEAVEGTMAGAVLVGSALAGFVLGVVKGLAPVVRFTAKGVVELAVFTANKVVEHKQIAAAKRLQLSGDTITCEAVEVEIIQPQGIETTFQARIAELRRQHPTAEPIELAVRYRSDYQTTFAQHELENAIRRITG